MAQEQQVVNPVVASNQMFANITKQIAQLCNFIEQLAMQIEQMQSMIPAEKRIVEFDSK
jgi:hypothetical protein